MKILIRLFHYSISQRIFIEHLLHAKYYSRYWVCAPVLALMKISQISKWDLYFTSEFTNSENYFTAYTDLLTYKYSSSLTIKLNQM